MGGKAVTGISFKAQIMIAVEVARRKCETVYGYYLTKRPPAPGANPADAIGIVSLAFRTWHNGICDDIWGWVCYARPLEPEEVADYELLPDEDNPNRYQQYSLVRGVKIIDEDGRSTVKRERVMENGKPYITSYPRKALVLMDEMKKASGGEVIVKIIKITPKKTTDGAPTKQ